jgi:hypothetical protein
MSLSSQAKPINGHAYIAARERAEHLIAELAEARRIEVLVEVDPGRACSEVVVHQIQLTYGRRTRVVTVDHETFMDEEFFRTLVLHQLRAVVGELASPA